MSNDLNTEIKIGADASGVEAGVGRAKRSLASLGESAKKAGDGLAGIGAGSERSAKQVEASTRSMVSQIQRQIAATEAGDKSTRQYQESLARLRGVNVNALKPYLDQLDAAKTKAATAALATDSFATSIRGMNSVLAGLGVALSAGAMVSFVKSAVDAGDATNKLSQKSGVAVTALRELNYAATLSDVSTEALGVGLRKLSQNMAEAAKGSKEQSAAFSAIGVNVKAMDGSLKGADVVLAEIATKFANFKDGPEKAALAIELFGKQGADLIPLLNSGASGLSEMAKEASALGVAFGPEFAKNAEIFNDNLSRIGASAEGAKIAIAGELIPTLNNLAESFIKAQDGASSFAANLGGGVRTAVEAVVILYTDVGFTLGVIGREFSAAVAKIEALKRLDIRGFFAISEAVKEDTKRARKELDKYQFDLLNSGILTSKAGAGRGTAPDPRSLGDPRTAAPIVPGAGADAAKKALADQNKELGEQAKLVAELSGLTGSFAGDWDRLTAIYKKGQLSLEGLTQAQAALLAKQPAIKAATEEQAKAEKLRTDAASALLAAETARVSAIEKSAVGMAEQNRSLTDEIELLGLSEQAQHAITQARLSSIIAIKEERVARLQNSEFMSREQIALEEEIRLLKERSSLQSQKFARTEAKKLADEQLKTQSEMWKSVDDVAHDTFVSIFDSGKSAFDRLKDTLKNGLYSLLYQMTVKKWLINVVASTSGQGVADQAFGRQGGGLMGLANNASSINSLWGAGSQFVSGGAAGASAASLGYANAVGAFGGDAIGALATANGGWAGVSTGAALTEAYGAAVAVEAGTAAGAAAGGAAATAGAAGATAGVTSALAAVPVWGWAALAGVAILGMSGKGGGPKTESGGGYGIGGYMNNGGPTADYARGIETGYAGLAKQLGLSSTLNVGAFSSQDKEGDSLTQLVVNAGLNGRSIYDRGARLGGVENVGRSDAELQAAMAEEATRVMIAALKSSDLEQDYKDFLNTVSDSATAAALESAVNRIIAVKGFKDAIEKLPFENLKNLSFAAADGLIAAAGGLQALSANLDTYYQNFYTAEEQRAQVIKNLFSALGAAGVDASSIYDPTLAGFRKLVEAQDVTTASGQKAYAALIGVSGAFAQLATSMTAADAGVVAATATLKKAMTDAVGSQAEIVKGLQSARADAVSALKSAQLDTASGAVSRQSDVVAGLQQAQAAAVSLLNRSLTSVANKASESLRGLSGLAGSLRSTVESVTGGPDRATAQGQIAAALATARAGGGLPSSESIAPALRALAASGEDTFRTLADYRRDQAITAGTLTALESLTGDQISIEQKQLDAVNAQLDALNGVNTSVLSVAAATANLASVNAALASEKTILATAQQQLDALKNVGDSVLSVADATANLAAIDANALNNVNTSVLSVADATANLAAIDAKLATEQTALTVAQAQLNAAFGTQDAVITVAEAMAGLSAALGVQEAARAAEAAAATQAAAAGLAEAAARAAIDAARAAYTYTAAVPPPPPVYIDESGRPGWMPSFDAGINSVPYDMTARIHKDERIMPAADNRELMARLSSPQSNNAELVAEMRALRQEVAGLRAEAQATAGHTSRTARLLDRAMPDGDALATRAAA